MKKTILLLLLVTVSFCISYGQVTEEERSMTQGINNSLMMIIPDADDKMVEKLWKKFMKTKDARTKKIRKSEEWLSENASISGIGGSCNVYATFEQSGGDVKMIVWFDTGEAYLSSMEQPERYTAGEDFMNNFELEVYKEGVKAEIKSEENKLKKYEANLKKLKRNNDRYHKEIEDAKKKIEKAEANIETNLLEQEETNIKIDDQKEVVDQTRRKLDARENQ